MNAPLAAEGPPVLIRVPGRPRTKGSLKPVVNRLGAGRIKVSLTESGQYSVPWKNQMIARIREQATCGRYPGAVLVDCVFRFAREPGDENPWPTSQRIGHEYGDIDKLQRNVLDALTQSGLIKDDSQVVGGGHSKRFAQPGEEPGVTIVVTPA